jgi:thioredoxin reductase (NADPH)
VSAPVILAVDDDPQVLAAVRRDLRSRYQGDYRVLAAGSGAEALSAVGELKARGDVLAMVISDQRMPSMLGVEVLSRSREIYPKAKYMLLTAYSDIEAAVQAINEVHLDHYLSKPWDPPEERLFPVVDDLLEAWQAEREPELTGLRLVGHQWSPRSHAIKDFLGGNLIPFLWLDAARDQEASRLLTAAEVADDELPALFLEGGTVLRNPERGQVAASLGLSTEPKYDLYDLVVVGAGPAGLAAAVYGASEGLRTVAVDRHGPGGQAGTSARIDNYLGFPAGVSGAELTRRAVAQARRLGAELLTSVRVVGMSVDGGYKRLELADRGEVVARAALIATGMTYQEHPAEGIAELTGAGVYYGAAVTEAQACAGRVVFIVGGGNSAGQAAMYLSGIAREVHLVVRRDGLSESMSQYLIDQLEAAANVRLRARTSIEKVEGEGRLQRLTLKSLADDSTTVEEAEALFVFIGSRPHSDWLPATVLRDSAGFVLTGRDVRSSPKFAGLWKERREPMHLETSVPGVFAAGDVRANAMNRIASAVGEGAMAVKLAHEFLAIT